MSLLHDAMKEKQREKAARAQPGADDQIVVEGFFPYVSSSAARPRSRRAPVIVATVAAAVFLTVVVWAVWPKNAKAPTPARAPIILPPPVTVVQKPVVTDSPTTAVVTRVPATEQTPAPVSSSQADPTARKSDDPARSRAREEKLPAIAGAAVSTTEREPAAEPVAASTPRVDYESQATLLFNAGDIAGARDRFALATRFAPTARAWTNLGVTLQRLGDLTGASSAYRSAIGLDANYLEAWLYQGRLAVEQGDAARAVPFFQRALAINPRNADVNVELARLEFEAQNWAEARRFAETAVRTDATNVRAYWYLAVASDPLKDVEAAIRGYSGYLRYVGDSPDQAKFVGWARTRLAELQGKP